MKFAAPQKPQEKSDLCLIIVIQIIQLQVTEIKSDQLKQKENEEIQWKETEESQKYKRIAENKNTGKVVMKSASGSQHLSP